MDCLFCKIAQREIPADIIYEDESVVVFSDIHPQAPQHKLIVPRQHIATLNDLTVDNADLIAHLTLTATQLAKKLQLADTGYRLLLNCNADGGQAVFHIHLHLLGGRQMHWPPG